MTITDDTFLQIRDEFPDLEAEVRSILLARAQDGATISIIKDDYKKMTGNSFPIYNSPSKITDFLLCIPYVTAMCNEHGTRIFNIKPTSKTQHLYDMVMLQKPQTMRPMHTQMGRQSHARNNNNYYSNYNNKYHAYNNNMAPKNIARSDKNSSRSDSTSSVGGGGGSGVVDYNCFYEDNYNYLTNRLVGQQQTQMCSGQNYNNNNNNDLIANNNSNIIDYNNNINNLNANNMATYNNLCSFANRIVQQQQQHEKFVQQPAAISAPQIEHVNPFRQTRPNLRPSLSPTVTGSSQHNESMFTVDSDYEAHLLDFPLLGDDFFLYLARMELKCKFKKYEKVLQSGLCISGQSIGAAIKRVQKLTRGNFENRRVIVNIGSVDIMQGKPLVQIEHDFRELINVMHKNGLTPIVTTLAPLANYSHIAQIKERLERFNQFIKRESIYLIVVDIWSCLVNEKRQTLFDCFQNEPRIVSGTTEPYVFWNKIGRQRVLQLIQSKLEY